MRPHDHLVEPLFASLRQQEGEQPGSSKPARPRRGRALGFVLVAIVVCALVAVALHASR